MLESFPNLLKLFESFISTVTHHASSFQFYPLTVRAFVNATLRLQFFFPHSICIIASRMCARASFFFFYSRWNQLFQEFPSYFLPFLCSICVQYNFMKFKNTWNFFPLIYSSISIVSIHRDTFLQIIRYTGMFVPTLSLRPIRFLTIKIYF